MRKTSSVVIGATMALAACSATATGHRATRRLEAPTTTAPLPATTVPTVERPVVFHGRRELPLVALTFDSNLTDAMIAELDEHKVPSFDNRRVIDELEALQVPATFFLAGKWMERYPEEVRRLAVNPAFELASHSYAHRAFRLPCFGLGGLAAGDMASDVLRSEQLLAAATPRPTRYFRFPGGCYDEAALRAIATTGVIVVQWDVASGDAFGHSVGAIVAQVLTNTHPGSIVVMHITGGNTAPLTAQALPSIVNGLRSRGFRLVKLSELLA